MRTEWPSHFLEFPCSDSVVSANKGQPKLWYWINLGDTAIRENALRRELASVSLGALLCTCTSIFSLIRIREVITMMVISTGKKRSWRKRDVLTSTKVDAKKASENHNGIYHVGLTSHSSFLLPSWLSKMLIMAAMACSLVMMPLEKFPGRIEVDSLFFTKLALVGDLYAPHEMVLAPTKRIAFGDETGVILIYEGFGWWFSWCVWDLLQRNTFALT